MLSENAHYVQDPSQGGKKNQKKGKDGTTELNEGGWTKDIEKHPKSADTFLSHHMPSSSSTQVHVESEDKPAENHDGRKKFLLELWKNFLTYQIFLPKLSNLTTNFSKLN